MEPVTIIVTAIVAGAALGIHDTARQAVRDAYNAIKSILRDRYVIDVSQLEKNPKSKIQQAAVAESIQTAGADRDQNLLEITHSLLEALEQLETDKETLGVDLADINAAYLSIGRILSTGTGLRIRRATFPEGIDIDEVSAGSNQPNPKKEQRQ